jgi:hypothetical protein
VNGVRFAACTLLAAICAVVLGGSADSARTQSGAAWELRPVSSGQKWLRVDVEGDTLYGFRVRGTDFTIIGIKSVRASGGPTPQCSVSGTPATLACDGDLPGGISVFVQLTTSGSAGSYDFALLFTPGDPNLIYVPSNQQAAPVPLGGSLGMTSPTAGRVTILNGSSSSSSFQQLEVEPVGFRVASVQTQNCSVTEGGGIACQRTLGPYEGAVIRFVASPFSGAPSAVLVAHGAGIGFIYVQAGDACPDRAAQLARIQVQIPLVKSQIALAERQLTRAERSLGSSKPFAKAAAQIRSARSALGTLRQRLTALRRTAGGRERKLKSCESGGARKAAASGTCDDEQLAAARADGTVVGLATALSVERRVAKRASGAVRLIKRVGPPGGPGWKEAIADLAVLVALPARTQSARNKALVKSLKAGDALTNCYLSLTSA